MSVKSMCDVDEKNLPNYQIFWVDEKQLKHTVDKFKAVDNNEAYAKLNEYAAVHDDHQYYQEVAERCYERAKEFDIQKMTESYAYAYGKLTIEN